MPDVNLADPDCEPTDEDFRELMKRAFAGLPEQEKAIREKLQRDIEACVAENRRRQAEREREP